MEEQTFLVALDVTEDATVVLRAARKLADQCNARLVYLTVVRPLAGVYGALYIAPYAVPNASFEEEALREAQAKLQKLVAYDGIRESDIHTKLGSPAKEINATAAELDCDLVIMGTHARTGIARLLGSTASAVLHSGLPCDVHLVNMRTKSAPA